MIFNYAFDVYPTTSHIRSSELIIRTVESLASSNKILFFEEESKSLQAPFVRFSQTVKFYGLHWLRHWKWLGASAMAAGVLRLVAGESCRGNFFFFKKGKT